MRITGYSTRTAILGFLMIASYLPAKAISSEVKPPSHTPLTRAIRLEKFDEAKALITADSVNQPDGGGYHPLTYAAYTSNTDFMKVLLEAGADPNVVEGNGKTALYVTANMANLEGLELLYKFKAKLPPEEALPPGKAAVYSSSLDCLKKLVKLYPNVDLNRGWNNRRPNGTCLDFSPGDPVAYAAYHGYDSMALYLLELGVKPVGIDFMGKGALHHAAINPQCSVELVKALIEAGCSPVIESYRIRKRDYFLNQIPSTPIDYAAVSGNFEKVKAMTLPIDASKQRVAIRNSAQLAAAYRHDQMAQYLLSLIGEKLATYREFINLPKSDNKTELSQTMPMSRDKLESIMPRSKSRPGAMPPEGSVAIISTKELRNGAALLEIELGKQNGIQLLERDALDAIAAEKSLRGLNDGDSKALHNSLDLIPAKHVVVMTQNKIAEREFVQVFVIDTASGLISATLALPSKIAMSPKGAVDVARAVMQAMDRNIEVRTGVTLTMIAPEILNHESSAAAHDINTVLPHLVGNTEGVALLSRDQLQYLQREKAIGVDGAYWAAAWVVDGGMGVVKDGKARLTLRAIHAMDKSEVKASYLVDVEQVGDGIRECWNELLKSMNAGARKDKVAVVEKDALEKEAQLLQWHAQWLFDAEYYPEAAQLMEACLELGQPDRERVKLAMMVQLKLSYTLVPKEYYFINPYFADFAHQNYNLDDPGLAVYGRWCHYGNAWGNQARCMSPSLRIKLLDSTDQIFRLGELAEARMRINPHHERLYGWTSSDETSNEILWTLYPFVTQALGDLLFYANALDHTMIKGDPADLSNFQAIADQIERITSQYLDHLEKLKRDDPHVTATRLKSNTVCYLLSRDFHFYSRYYPKLHERMMALLHEQIGNPGQSISELQTMCQLAGSKSIGARELSLREASESWRKLSQSIQMEGSKRGVVISDVSNVYFETARDERVKLLSGISEWITSQSNHPVGNLHPAGNLVAMDVLRFDSITGEIADGTLLGDFNELAETAEYLRMSAFYHEVEKLIAMDERTLIQILGNRLSQSKNATKSPIVWSQDVWRDIRTIISSSRKINPAVDELLLGLAGVDKKDDLVRVKVDLTNTEVIVMPLQEGHNHRSFNSVYERASIYQDELWLPGTYSKDHQKYEDRKEDLDVDFAIQVVSLKDRSTQTIIIPGDPMEATTGYGKSMAITRSYFGRVEVTDEFAYFSPNGLRLFCIRRSDYHVSEVPIPDVFKRSKIQLKGVHEKTGSLIVIVGEWRDDQTSMHQVLLVKGNEINKTLVSNRRKPSQSPLDYPNIQPNKIEVKGDTIWVGDSNTNKGYAYDLISEEWKKLSASQVDGMYANYYDTAFDSFEVDVNSQYACYETSPKGYRLGFSYLGARCELSSGPTDAFAKNQMDDIEVIATEVDDPSFRKKLLAMYSFTGKSKEPMVTFWPNTPYINEYKGWWISPNEAIKNGHYGVNVMGKWNHFYLIGLHHGSIDESERWTHRQSGFPGVWLVPEAKIEEAKKPLKARYSRLVDLQSAWEEMQFKDAAVLEYISSKNDFKWIRQNYIEMAGGGAVLAIKPSITVKDMQLVIRISPKKMTSPLDFRFEVGDEENPKVVFDSKQQGMGTGVLHIPLPDGVDRVRLINNSPKDNSIRIEKFLFMEKE